jgi:site-specific recombinase XerC
VLDPAEARQLLDAIDIATPIGLRDRALVGLMVFSFARIGAALDDPARRPEAETVT